MQPFHFKNAYYLIKNKTMIMKNKYKLICSLLFLFISGMMNAQIKADFIAKVKGPKVEFINQTTSNPQSSTLVYRWDFGDGSSYYYTNSLDNFTHTYSNAIDYTVDLIAMDTSGILSNASSKSIIFIDCIAKFEYTIDNQNVNFYNTSKTNFLISNYNYSWSFGDGTKMSTNSPSITKNTYSQIKDYIVTLNVADSKKNCSDTFIDTISIKCLVDFDYYILGDSIQFNNISKSVGNFTNAHYSWDFDNGDTSNLENPIYKYPISDSNYYVTFSVSNNPGCNGQVQHRVIVGNPLQDISVTYYKQDSGINFPVNDARLFLIQYDYATYTYSLIDSMDISNDSVYIFKDINPGYYLLKMALLPTDTDYSEYVPTYYGYRAFTWMNSYMIYHNNVITSKTSINLQKIQSAGGNKLIEGYVYNGESRQKNHLKT